MVAVSYNYSGDQTGDVERYTSPRLTCDIQAFENTQKFLQQNKAWKTLFVLTCFPLLDPVQTWSSKHQR